MDWIKELSISFTGLVASVVAYFKGRHDALMGFKGRQDKQVSKVYEQKKKALDGIASKYQRMRSLRTRHSDAHKAGTSKDSK